MSKIKALIIYVFVALVALLVGVFLNAEAGLITFFILFLTRQQLYSMASGGSRSSPS